MKSLMKTVQDIKTLKIQGAENIAKSAVKCLKETAVRTKKGTTKEFITDINSAMKKLSSARPTEPCLRNSLKYVSLSLNPALSMREVKEDVISSVQKVLKHFMHSNKVISDIGCRKIRNGSIVFTHCHSTTVMSILKTAKKARKNFVVHNTETRPRFQGRLTAVELGEAGIPVHHFVDSAARIALKKADIMLIGCDAITPDRVINKIGSEMFAEFASNYDIPLYVCTDSWKFDPMTIYGSEERIEQRDPKEVWEKAHKNVKIYNPAFERIKPGLVTGIISELGIYPPSVFIEEVKSHYSWIF